MKKLLFIGILCFTASANAAIDCSKMPSCMILGFDQTEEDCAGRSMLKCPMDTSKVFCGDITSDECPTGMVKSVSQCGTSGSSGWTISEAGQTPAGNTCFKCSAKNCSGGQTSSAIIGGSTCYNGDTKYYSCTGTYSVLYKKSSSTQYCITALVKNGVYVSFPSALCNSSQFGSSASSCSGFLYGKSTTQYPPKNYDFTGRGKGVGVYQIDSSTWGFDYNNIVK